jgi:hypothetical protein
MRTKEFAARRIRNVACATERSGAPVGCGASKSVVRATLVEKETTPEA